MKTYNFTLVLSGKNEPSEDLENVLFEAGCDDATLYFRNGIPYLDFDRETNSFEEAVISAIQQVEEAQSGLKVERVEPDDLVTIAQIARRLDKTREYIRLLTEGKRGSGDFPPPIAGFSEKSLIWSWKQVSKWCFAHHLIEAEAVTIAQNIADINHILFYRGDRTALKRMMKLQELLTVT
jgi:hypothetical protein